MTKSLEMVIEWQVRNPEIQDAEQALDFLKQRKGELGLE